MDVFKIKKQNAVHINVEPVKLLHPSVKHVLIQPDKIPLLVIVKIHIIMLVLIQNVNPVNIHV